MKTMNALRDWWRGYSDEDMAYVIYQHSEYQRTGEMWPMTARQRKAYRAMQLGR
jgi:hypothetical protein